MWLRRPSLVTAGAVALVVAAAFPVSAHPFFADEGGTAPAGSLTTLTLAVGHGCGTESETGGGVPTLEVSLEVPPAFSYLEPVEVDGYEASVEGEDEQLPEVVTWTATDGGVDAPELPMNAVVEGEPGDEVYVRVLQRCEDDSYRWVGTPDDPADDPAVLLTLVEPDPDAPPPPDPTAAPAPDEEGMEDEGSETAGDEPDDDPAEDTVTDGDDTRTVEDLPTEPPEDEGGGLGWLPIVLGAIVLAALGGLLGARRRPVQDPTAMDDDGMPPPSDDR